MLPIAMITAFPVLELLRENQQDIKITHLPLPRLGLNVTPQIPYLGVFGLEFNKNYYQTFNQHPVICETINFHPK